MKTGDKVKILRRSDKTDKWIELYDDRGNSIKGVIQSLSCNRDNEPIFANVLIREGESVYFEELLAINSPRLRLVKC